MAETEQLIRELQAQIAQLTAERNAAAARAEREATAAQIVHDAYLDLEAENDRLRQELAVAKADLQQRERPFITHPDDRVDLLADALRPFADAGRHIPDDARPTTYDVPGSHRVASFNLDDLRLAAAAWDEVIGWDS